MGQKSGSPHVSFFLLRQALLVYRLPLRLHWVPSDPQHIPACLALSCWTYEIHMGPCVSFPLRCHPSLSCYMWTGLNGLRSPAFPIYLTSQRAGCAGSKTLVLWLALHGNHLQNFPFSGYEFGLKKLLILVNSQVMLENHCYLRKIILEQPKCPFLLHTALFFGQVNDLIFIHI